MKRHLLYMLAAFATVSAILPSCRTTEANYRAAYEKAVAGRDESVPLDSTIYGRYRRDNTSRAVRTERGDTVEVTARRAALVPGLGDATAVKSFVIVAGQFKQRFNAESMRSRLVDGGYKQAFVLATAEPYYYVAIDSYDSSAEAADALGRIASGGVVLPVKPKAPCPFILCPM